MDPKEYVIHAVAFPHGDHWVAQCLEHDIATQASTPDELLYELERILVAHLLVADEEELADPFVEIPKAPKRFWEMYGRARSTVQTVPAPELPVPKKRKPKVQVAFAQAA